MTTRVAKQQTQLQFRVAQNRVHQLLTPTGEVVGMLPDFSPEQLLAFYRWMLLGRVYSDRMVALQRQGRMGTFAPIIGQEATSLGLTTPLEKEDWLIASYRENLSYLVKGVPIVTLMKQWGGHVADDYPREAHCLPFQIVLGTQMLHAVGVAQGMKLSHDPHVVVTVCGDGATSEGDFSEALNFAGVYQAPVIFVVQNNGWAISTPFKRQTGGEYIADRAHGFGMPGYVVDGNDFFAVHQVVAEAIGRAKAGDGPTLIEAITYRMGAHTTADDPTKYRSAEVVEQWAERDPLQRYRTFLINQKLLTKEADEAMHEATKAEMEAAVTAYENLPTPNPLSLFDMVYAKPSRALAQQRQQFQAEFNQPPVFSGQPIERLANLAV